jgi:predicted RNA-binding Zn-ribbon protein involved in translation (DUF1610 family)
VFLPLAILLWPLITVGVLLAALLLFIWWCWTGPEQLITRRMKEGRCPMCGHALAGDARDACPNCGWREPRT